MSKFIYAIGLAVLGFALLVLVPLLYLERRHNQRMWPVYHGARVGGK